MKTLYDPSTADEARQRIAALGPGSTRLWGKMTAAQMLAHCSVTMETAVGDRIIPRVMIGRILGPLVKSAFSNDKPLSKNGPTAPAFLVKDDHDLPAEQQRLSTLIDRFSQGGPAGCTGDPHCFFGKLSAEEWGKGMYKHLDHHLRQFSV